LLINGSLAAASAVTVANGARLGGTGTINGTVTVAGGGALDLRDATTGTLSLTNSVALASPTTASNLFFDIGTGLGSNDVVAITGTPTLGAGGAIITINALGSSLTPGHYTLMTAAGGLGTSGFSLASSSIVAGTTTYNLSLASSTSTAQILSITAVPEPTFLGMVGLSLMGMIGARRRV
jgi:fibronectin-binding autotransporter adhesin